MFDAESAKEIASVFIVTSVVMTLASNGLINDQDLTQEAANVLFDSIAKDVVAILNRMT